MLSSKKELPSDTRLIHRLARLCLQRWFYVNRSLPLGSVFEAWCERAGVALGSVRFLYKGDRVYGASSPASLGMEDGQEVTAVPESSDRLQQLREWGPLFDAMLGGMSKLRDVSSLDALDGLDTELDTEPSCSCCET